MVSVIIPVYNAEKSITRALDSVLNQAWHGEFEVIIINDGSEDQSANLIEKYITAHPSMSFKFINQQNQGVSVARNNGLKVAEGAFIALLDADDEWLPEKTEIQMKYFDADESIDFLAARRNGRKLLFPYASNKDLVEVTFRKLLLRNEITVPSVIFKRKVLTNTGFFQEGQNHAEDIDFYLRASKNNRMFIVNRSLVIAGNGKRSFGVSGLSADLEKMADGYQQNIERLFTAKRIGRIQYTILKFFYLWKHRVLLIRNYFHKSGKQ